MCAIDTFLFDFIERIIFFNLILNFVPLKEKINNNINKVVKKA